MTQPRAGALAPGEAGTSEPASPANGVGLGRIAGYAAVVVVVAFAVVFFVWRHHSSCLAASQTAATRDGMSAGGQAQPAGQADSIRALLEPLLQSPDWSDSRLVALNEALLEAGRPQIDAVRDTDWFDAVLDSVRSRLLQQQALSGTPLTPDRSPLAALAVTLGIDLTTATAGPDHVATSGAERETKPSNAATPPQRASRVTTSERTAEQARGPQGASGVDTSSQAKSESSSAPARVPGHAGTGSAAASHGGSARITAPAAGTAASSETTPQVTPSDSPAATAPDSSQKTSAHHPYPACSAALSHVRLNYCQDFLESGDPAPLLVLIPGGSFMMGNGESAAEGPVHRVTLSHDFAMTAYEVSQAEFQRYCRAAGKDCPAQPWSRPDDPVVDVSWSDAQDYAKWLSRATHQRYRLPTEAEWEYAARAGRTGLYPSGDTLSPTDAYFSMGQTLTAPAPRSMRFNANAWHLTHMVGNVREWVEDAWSPNFAGAPADGSARTEGESGIKVVRGGCYADPAIKLRLTTREPLAADGRDRCTGIRLVREIH
ncbi:MAG: SUMF1/EgtB/PvdO family nonheme iron enzyme [Steroidobacteraceae bacterium]